MAARVRLAPGWRLGPNGEDIGPAPGAFGGPPLPPAPVVPRTPSPPLARALEHGLDAIRQLASVAKRNGFGHEAEQALESLKAARLALDEVGEHVHGSSA